jgi:transcriptional regulator with XRE-family HTH domain
MEKLVAKNIKFLRIRGKLSQEQFALKIGLNRGNVASYEKGTAEPSITNILKIVKYFNIDLVELVEYDLMLLSELTSGVELPMSLDSTNTTQLEGSSQFDRLKERSADLQQILLGMRKFHLYKKAKGFSDIDRMVKDYEDLLEVMNSLLITHQELLSNLNTTWISSNEE